jgi:hypothetical protein
MSTASARPKVAFRGWNDWGCNSFAGTARFYTFGRFEMSNEYVLPDGSAFMVASLPLPKDHWLTAPGHNVPPMLLRCGDTSPERIFLREAIVAAARHAVRAATMNGADSDFDPDALVQNMVVGLLGYHTEDGLSSDDWANPKNAPAEFRCQEIRDRFRA